MSNATQKQQQLDGTSIPELEGASESYWRQWHTVQKAKEKLRARRLELDQAIAEAVRKKQVATPMDLTQECTIWSYTGTGPEKEPIRRKVVYKPTFNPETDRRKADEAEDAEA